MCASEARILLTVAEYHLTPPSAVAMPSAVRAFAIVRYLVGPDSQARWSQRLVPATRAGATVDQHAPTRSRRNCGRPMQTFWRCAPTSEQWSRHPSTERAAACSAALATSRRSRASAATSGGRPGRRIPLSSMAGVLSRSWATSARCSCRQGRGILSSGHRTRPVRLHRRASTGVFGLACSGTSRLGGSGPQELHRARPRGRMNRTTKDSRDWSKLHDYQSSL